MDWIAIRRNSAACLIIYGTIPLLEEEDSGIPAAQREGILKKPESC